MNSGRTTGASTPAALEITGLRKRYGQKAAVDDLSLRVDKGEIFGILGPNGAYRECRIAHKCRHQ